MLTKIFLILAILIGIAAAILGFTQIKPKIEDLQTKLVDETEKRGQQTTRANKAEKDRDAEKAAKEAETARHNTTKGKLRQTESELAGATEQISQLNIKITKVTADLTAAKQEFNAWLNLGIDVDKIKDMIAELKAEKLKNEALNGENKMLATKLRAAENYIKILIDKESFDDEEGVPMPTDLKAKVVAIDPKWDFVVLDVGKAQEAREGGNMLIYRDGKLIAKVKIRSLTENTCVATIMSGWKLVDVTEGDLALHRPVKRTPGQ
jgi:hypothetical protein